MKINQYFFVILSIVFFAGDAFTQGGPPMLTDDSGTPGDGNWENNFAAIYQGSKSDYSIGIPVFDLNYGVGERIQLNLQANWTSGPNEALLSRFDNISPGCKYRFLDAEKDGLDMSIYPHIIFSWNTDEKPKSIAYGFILPLAASKEFFSVQFNGQIGWQVLGNTSELFYGIVAGKEIIKGGLLMLELHEAFDRNNSLPDPNEIFLHAGTFFNLGTQWALSKTFTILAAFGKDLDANASDPGMPRFYGYAGLQLHL